MGFKNGCKKLGGEVLGLHKNSATPKKYGVLGRTVALGSDTFLTTLESILAGIIIDTLGSC